MIRLIVADDHTLVRAGICSLLKSKDDIEIVAETGSGEEAAQLCISHKPDVLLLDFELKDIDGMEVTKKVTSTVPSVKILILTMHENEEYALRLLRAGASGFIVKGISPEILPDAIRQVASGDIFVTESIMKRITIRQARGETDNPISKLSNRELQIFIRLAKGVSYNDIRNELNLSISTIGTYKSRIMEKLALDNNTELIKLAMRIGLVDKNL